MDVVRDDVKKLVDKELESANKQFPLFQSPHEGYAVLLEEVEELGELSVYLNSKMRRLWREIRLNEDIETMFEKVDKIKLLAVSAATESIQVAAMCDKFKLSFKDELINE